MDNEKQVKKQFFIKTLITLAILIVISVIIILFRYDFTWSLINVSNSLFIVNAPVFFIALIMQTGATRATLAVSYTARTMFSYKKTKDQYDSFQDYYDERSVSHQKDVRYILLANIILMLIAFILAQVYIDTVPNM